MALEREIVYWDCQDSDRLIHSDKNDAIKDSLKQLLDRYYKPYQIECKMNGVDVVDIKLSLDIDMFKAWLMDMVAMSNPTPPVDIVPVVEDSAKGEIQEPVLIHDFDEAARMFGTINDIVNSCTKVAVFDPPPESLVGNKVWVYPDKVVTVTSVRRSNFTARHKDGKLQKYMYNEIIKTDMDE